MKKKINSLQILRAFAFVGILASHCGFGHFGSWGVSVFLVLSGFLMIYSYGEKKIEKKSCLEFPINKIKKLYLLYFLTFLCYVPFELGNLIENFSNIGLWKFFAKSITNLLLLQSWIPSSDFYFSFNGVSWYLSTIFFCYLLFPYIKNIIIKFDVKKSIFGIIVIFLFQFSASFLVHIFSLKIVNLPDFVTWLTYIFPIYRLGDFIIGCFLGKIFVSKKNKFKNSFATFYEFLTVIIIIIIYYLSINNILIFGNEEFSNCLIYLPTTIFLIYLFACNQGKLSFVLNNKIIIYLGNISQSGFLIHQVIIRYFDAFSKKFFDIQISGCFKFVICLLLTIIASELYMYIYKKIRKRSKLNV